ncbi:uncharacterized protein CcaverHIS019_0108610 [Cutaneotrichosporon cavernicola]|uniref:Uncharacterized protein n=1 Tax=Cutaneotrichosporon cavernicola TaxID=279322 RepID=A0AA48II21_9TREE|nr:uncharacterized protein CcaverHIS019_0108610 [Cutaneotrichosporon cavernicola]BEI88143.1 hypothetical protein CcaverHIS019_0108610 [Cutaneotrichosporon cavernicola]BEI95913.1 hypothetical protein CcaverHIS631_0108620 [Cutaneotrichosporon cavernicola]BEJ03688.1 hypothetical protein CcaverHIS641_0108630 [Cutaneotrichosporon cavernicola]
MDLLSATTPEHPSKPHPLEVQSGTKLRLHIERIPPTSTSVVHISRAIGIANEILLGLFPATYNSEAYAEAFGRCRSVSLVVACVRTFFEVESVLAERHAVDEIARKRAQEMNEAAPKSVAEVGPEVVINDSQSCSSYLEPGEPTGFLGRRASAPASPGFLSRRSSRSPSPHRRVPAPPK